MLKLKLQYSGLMMWRTDSFEKTLTLERLKAGGEGDDSRWDSWMSLPTWWTWVWASSRSWWWTGKPGVLQSMGWQRVRHDWVTLSLRKWDFSPALWQKQRGSMCTLDAGRACCFGRIYTGAECRGGGNVRTQGCWGRWGRAAYYFVCSGLVSSSSISPGLSWGTQAECESNVTSRHGCWQDQDTNLSIVSHMDPPLLLLGCFHSL